MKTNSIGEEGTVSDSVKSTSWEPLRQELWKRTYEPAAHASYGLYFFIAVIVIGAGGVWLELYSYFVFGDKVDALAAPTAGLRTAVITFFPALAGSSCMQLVWAEDRNKSLRSFAVTVLVVMALIAIAISPTAIKTVNALWVGSLASLVALWTWWIANAKQQDLLDGNLDAPLGKKDLQSDLAGDLSGFKV